ncbi:MAG: hypothetical protein RMK98_05180 [Bacteroidia bacterium]|nr:hypothetical protein [Bacteroidia bacterium]
MRLWIFALFLSSLFAQSPLQIADNLLRWGRYAAALTVYASLIRSRPMADTLRLRVYLSIAEVQGRFNELTSALRWIAPTSRWLLAQGHTPLCRALDLKRNLLHLMASR